MHLELAAVLTLDLDLVDAAAGAVPIVSIVSLDLGEGSAAHRSDRGALGLLGVEAGEPLLKVSAVIVRSEIVPTWVIVEWTCFDEPAQPLERRGYGDGNLQVEPTAGGAERGASIVLTMAYRRRRRRPRNNHPCYRRVGHWLGLRQRRGDGCHRCDLWRGYQGDRLRAGGLHNHTDASREEMGPPDPSGAARRDRDSLPGYRPDLVGGWG